VLSLPEWMDVSTFDSEFQKQEAYVRQTKAVTNFIASCNEAQIPFCQAFHYLDGSLKCYFWTENNSNGNKLTNQLQQLDQLIQITFKGIKTEIKYLTNNPIAEILENASFSKTVFRGGYLSGDFVKETKAEPPMIDQLNSYFRFEKKTGFLFISNQPTNQSGFFYGFQRFLANRKYSKLTSQSQENVSQSGLGGSKSIVKVNRKKQLELVKFEAKLKRLDARIISNTNFMLIVSGLESNLETAKLAANNTFTMAKTSLFPFLQSNSQFPLDFYDYSANEIREIIQDISSCQIPNSPNYFELLPEETASLCRFPSLDTLPINREQKTVSQIHQPKITSSGIPLGKIISSDGSPSAIYNLDPDNLVLQSLVTGTTGSGKTSTICSKIIHLERLGIKSLIIDPKGVVFPILREFLSDIHVFEFGKESTAPGRCNILECPEWMDVQTHLNLVENILLSVWEIFPPMNMILHRALSRLFNSDGWSVRLNKHGKNRILGDLKKEIHKIQRKMGYSKETHLDISSAMEMRLNYFMQGQIGTQINCSRSIPIPDILEKTTILSLQHANNYAEKVVVLTFLGRIFEFFKKKSTTDNLRHFLIVDEAEHYFGVDQLNYYDDYEKASAGKAATKKLVEMIAQSRAYGLGIEVATQSPSKLPREIMINCNTKIVHKIIDGSDISYLQGSMRLTEGQANMLPALSVGEALVIDVNNPYPFKLKISIPSGMETAGKGVQADYIENLMRDQMKQYFLENHEMFEIKDEREITTESVDALVALYLPKESLLTEDDNRLMRMDSFGKMFKRTVNRIFGMESEDYTEEYHILFLAKFVEIWQRQITNGHQKAAVVEFFDKAFRLHFQYTPEGRDKIMRWIITIVKISEE
ncbi:MAG: ATP-binding protein, partial [Candidatus Heimdallarchaeota archaeon]|nr:ATP-binding protein [Candidatus Heimdallarchaeota archaeon]